LEKKEIVSKKSIKNKKKKEPIVEQKQNKPQQIQTNFQINSQNQIPINISNLTGGFLESKKLKNLKKLKKLKKKIIKKKLIK
jgi:hypothetical protein